MIAQILEPSTLAALTTEQLFAEADRIGSKYEKTVIPPFIYPDSEDQDRCIALNVTGYAGGIVYQVDLSVQVRHGSRYLLGQVARRGNGWAVVSIQRDAIEDGIVHESVEAAAIACDNAFRETRRLKSSQSVAPLYPFSNQLPLF
jgi:hypothetical protein